MTSLNELQMPTSRQDVTDLINNIQTIQSHSEGLGLIGQLVQDRHMGHINISVVDKTGGLTPMFSIDPRPVDGKGYLIYCSNGDSYWTGS